MWYNIMKLTKSQKVSVLDRSNARDTTNFTTKCLQTDMTS
jgi:hypothetical protein